MSTSDRLGADVGGLLPRNRERPTPTASEGSAKDDTRLSDLGTDPEGRHAQPLSHEKFVRRIDSTLRAGTTRLFESR